MIVTAMLVVIELESLMRHDDSHDVCLKSLHRLKADKTDARGSGLGVFICKSIVFGTATSLAAPKAAALNRPQHLLAGVDCGAIYFLKQPDAEVAMVPGIAISGSFGRVLLVVIQPFVTNTGLFGAAIH